LQSAPLLGLPVPTAHSGGEDPLGAGHAKVRYDPPSGFGYPLDGFLPLPPRRACFVPTALLGLIPSKRSPLTRWLARFRVSRTCMSLAGRDLPLANQRTGAPSTDFQALALARVPGCPRGINPRLAGGSLGIFPFQGIPPAALLRLPPEAPLTRLAREASQQRAACTSGFQSATG
jgi:hypothetical protein